jgi:hypothetical protein
VVFQASSLSEMGWFVKKGMQDSLCATSSASSAGAGAGAGDGA